MGVAENVVDTSHVHGGAVVFKSDCSSVGHLEIAYTDQSWKAITLKHRSMGRYRQVPVQTSSAHEVFHHAQKLSKVQSLLPNRWRDPSCVSGFQPLQYRSAMHFGSWMIRFGTTKWYICQHCKLIFTVLDLDHIFSRNSRLQGAPLGVSSYPGSKQSS